MEKLTASPQKVIASQPQFFEHDNEEEDAQENMICPIHSKKYEFICVDCQQKLCPDCLFEEYTSPEKKHKDHQIQKYVSKINEIKKQLKIEIDKATEIFKKLEEFVANQDDISKRFDNQMYETKTEMCAVFRSFQKSLDEKYQLCEASLSNNSSVLNGTVITIQKMAEEAQALFLTNDISVFPNATDFLDRMNTFISSIHKPTFEAAILDPPEEVLPPFSSHIFEINGFTELCEKTKKAPESSFVYLPEFKEYGAKWRIKLYPCGNSKGALTHISLFLEVLKGMENKYSFFYQVVIYNDNTGASYERHYTSDFTNLDSWGWNRYFPIKSIFDNEFLDKATNKLTIKVNIRPVTYTVYTDICNSIYQRKQDKYNKLKDLAIKKGIKEKKEMNLCEFPPLPCSQVSSGTRLIGQIF